MQLDQAVLATLASPRRQEILRLIWKGERSAGDIHKAMPDVTFGAISLQLGALSRAGLVRVRAEGRNRFYQVEQAALGPVATMLEQMWGDALWRLKIAAEMEHARRGPQPRRAKTRKRKSR